MKIIGLTGGIASGKSTVSNMLKNLGAIIIDADKIARDIVQKDKPALREIVCEFGLEILDKTGQLNRKKLGTIVFNNPLALEKLNSITHPKIVDEIKNEINWYKQYSNNSVIIVDAALLLELNLQELVDELWIVFIPMDIQRKRLIDRDGITIDEANNRIGAQMPNEAKLKLANKIIFNTETLEELKKQVEEFWFGIIDRKI